VAEEVKHKLGLGFEFIGEQRVKNIAEPLAVYRVLLEGSPPVAAARARSRLRLGPWLGAGGILLAAIIAGLTWGLHWREQALPLSPPAAPAIAPDAPSLAVLPFANMSNDAAFDYFADGVTETLIAGLSRSSEIRVIARTSSDAYKGKAEDIRQIGKELGARYIVEGSVQKGSGKVRIVAQLIDATTGDHVWADRYDREGSDALTLQDEVTEKIVASLAGDQGLIKKKEYEQAWGKDRANLEEYDYYLRGHQLFYRFTKDDTLQAIKIWQEGLAKFPDSSLLRIEIAWGYYQLVYGGWSSDVAGDYRRAFGLAQEGLAGKSVPPVARTVGHFLMAYLQVEYKKDWDKGLQEREMTLALAPNDPVALASMSEIAIRAGRPDDAIASLSRDIAWDPNYEFSSPEMRLGWAYFVKGDYKTALSHLKLDRNDDPVWTWPFLAATYAQLGMTAEARATVAKIRAANPSVTLAFMAQVFSYRDETVQQRFIDALRKAGLPE
jgi:TolB-like protein